MKRRFVYLLGVMFAVGVLLLLYSLLIEPRLIEVKHYKISEPRLTGIKIVFATDLHTAPYDEKRLDKIVDTINKQQPDIIILGGDYVKGHKKSSSLSIEKIADALGNLYASYGVYAVLGNHDIWYGKQDINVAMLKQNIRLLDDENIKLLIKGREFSLAGVADPVTQNPDLVKTFAGAVSPTVLVSHSPDVFPNVDGAELVLAGHTHGGQINLPFIGAPIVPSAYGQRYKSGLIAENGKTMIVSKGLGTSILPIRFNCKPEIVVIEFE